MRLHYHPLSSYSRKVTLAIALRGDAVELSPLDVFSGALKRAEFLAMSPFGKMPALETPDGPVFESTSIIEYLEARGPRRLIPQGHELRARHFDRLGDLYLLEPIGKFFWDKSDEARDGATTATSSAWAVWERALDDGRRFVCGDEITLADLSAAIALHYASTEGVVVTDALRRYDDRLREVPAVRASDAAAAPFIEATKARRVKR